MGRRVAFGGFVFAGLMVLPIGAAALEDWPNLSYYRSQNETLPPPVVGAPRVVFYGDSITQVWRERSPKFFEGTPFVDRGIAGQTSPQLLIRFQQDVVALRPKIVLVLAGVNDIIGNTGPSTNAMIEDNIRSMVAVGEAAQIKVLLCSVLPINKPDMKGALLPPAAVPGMKGRIQGLNAWLRDYAAERNTPLVDYYSAMADREGDLASELSTDGVHPNQKGFALMQPVALAAIAKAERTPAPPRL